MQVDSYYFSFFKSEKVSSVKKCFRNKAYLNCDNLKVAEFALEACLFCHFLMSNKMSHTYSMNDPWFT